jgi:hypothetical protein
MNAFQEAIKALLVKARDEGMTRDQAAKALGVAYWTLNYRIKEFGIEWAHGSFRTDAPDDRAKDIIARSEAGETLEGIGADYGITRERVRQIVKKFGGRSKREMHHAALIDLAAFLKDNPMTLAEARASLGKPQSAISDAANMVGVEFLKIPAAVEAELAPLAELVKAGTAIHEAAGGNRALEGRLRTYCASKGIKSVAPSRWSVSPRRAEMIAGLLSQDYTWEQIAAAVTELEGTRPANASSIYAWAHSNMDIPRRKRKFKPVCEPKQRQPKPLKIASMRPPKRPAEIDLRETIRETAIINRGKATAAEIASACGTTRNSIIGYWFRARQDGAIA